MLFRLFPLISAFVVQSMAQPCKFNSDCPFSSELRCLEGSCAALSKLGEPCEVFRDCELHLRCSEEGACAELLKLGEACEIDWDCDDRNYLKCLDGSCNEKPGVGSPCNVNLDCDVRTSCVFNQCTNSTDLECSDNMNCTIDGLTCVYMDLWQTCSDLSVGSYCMNRKDCSSNICRGLFCSEGKVGDSCSDDGECRQGNYCALDTCMDGSDGSYCDTDSQCKNGTCVLDDFRLSTCSRTKAILLGGNVMMTLLVVLVVPLAVW